MWKRLIYPSSAMQRLLKVSLRPNRLVCLTSKMRGKKRCVLSRKGYLVLYNTHVCDGEVWEERDPAGYALDIRDATGLSIVKKQAGKVDLTLLTLKVD